MLRLFIKRVSDRKTALPSNPGVEGSNIAKLTVLIVNQNFQRGSE
jgi:hypothetical protein